MTTVEKRKSNPLPDRLEKKLKSSDTRETAEKYSECVRDLLKWAVEQGADVDNLDFREEAGDDPFNATRTVYARRAISCNSPIAQIPAHLILSEATARTSHLGARLTKHFVDNPATYSLLSQSNRDPYAPGLILLSAYLIYERYENPTSFWRPYLEVLPRRYELPIWWEEEEIDRLLGGTGLKHIVRERRKVLETGLKVLQDVCGDLFKKHSLTWENMLWAYSAISSRAFPRSRNDTSREDREHAAEEAVEVAEGTSELCLYPILDMLNHRRGERIEWQIADKTSVTFVTLDNIEAGAQIFNNYGAKGNENLLGNYGFVLSPNPEDYVKVALNIYDSDPLAEKKRDMLACKTPNRLVHLLFAGDDEVELPKDLLTVTRILVMNSCELSATWKDDAIVGSRNEIATLATLWSLMSKKLSDLSNVVVQEDGKYRTRMVRTYRDGQSTILKHNMNLCRTTLQKFFERARADHYRDVVPPTSSNALTTLLFLNLTNEHLSHPFISAVDTLQASLQEDFAETFDEDTLLCIALLFEKTNKDSVWKQVLPDLLQPQEVESILAEQKEDIVEHFEDVVMPVLQVGGDLCNWIQVNDFLWAAAVLGKYGVALPGDMVDGIEGFGLVMVPQKLLLG
ncbi:uncharacterized protein SPPG_04331 [Spizellomyces punctatus DAOM BR117]|uniref:SET domain-containing protein n=1 Tax=Spizellomyces punctatus (strain DAOM BR117) TaxID=645134 RepID=A0A0L0HK29_SPIPD|nr:uncharacterized protein SPPG_04331 [Spizellomyces punctatus DAOM BR117]KND01240.1 hypothetical protein SPPG_04331 [Spizellomyces punctatus DAOM BR117]|eukprot:XP_016609279.1 hypothetical protein SPPG_04331 [Spizellomyces punctatus DAOM BR117]